MCAQRRKNTKILSEKFSDQKTRLGKASKIAPKPQKRLFAIFNFGIANLKRIIELTKFKNENFQICN